MCCIFKALFLLTLALGLLCTALIHPADPFNAIKDARILRKAMKGWGTDEDSITKILTHRSGHQRAAISKAFNTEINRDLYNDLESELSGNYWNLIRALVTPLPEYYARVLYRASRKTDSEAIVDILITSSNAELCAINEAYKRLMRNPMIEVSTNLTRKNQLLSHNMIWKAFEGARNENQKVDVRAAIDAAKYLHNIGEQKTGYLRTWTEEREVETIYVTNSYSQLHQIFKEYETLYNHSIKKAFTHTGFHSDLENGILNMVSAIESTPKYYAKRLLESMDMMGTNEDMLIRIIVGRSEIDLNDIREAFDKNNEKSLASWIVTETSGDFKRALLAIVDS